MQISALQRMEQQSQQSVNELAILKAEMRKLNKEKAKLDMSMEEQEKDIVDCVRFVKEMTERREEMHKQLKENQERLDNARKDMAKCEADKLRIQEKIEEHKKKINGPEDPEEACIHDQQTLKELGVHVDLRNIKDHCMFCGNTFCDPPARSLDVNSEEYRRKRRFCRALLLPCCHVTFCFQCATQFYRDESCGRKCPHDGCSQTMTMPPVILQVF